MDYHLRRLEWSASCFRFAMDLAEVRRRLSDYSRELSQEPRKVWLELAANGAMVLTDERVKPSTPVAVALSVEPVDSHDEFLRHKTTRRAVFERALAGFPAAQQPDQLMARSRLVGAGRTVYLQSAAHGAADPCARQRHSSRR